MACADGARPRAVLGPRPPDDRRYDVGMWHNPHPSKGGAAGWQALLEARRQVPGLRAVVFSATPLPDTLANQVEDLPWLDVRLGLDQPRLADEVFNQTRVFLQSSVHEGFGYTAVEAMACGAALVSTDNGGSRDYAIHEETAIVVPPKDSRASAGGVERLSDDEAPRAPVAAAGERLVRRFDWDVGAEILEGHLERYLADPEAFQSHRAPTCRRHSERARRPDLVFNVVWTGTAFTYLRYFVASQIAQSRGPLPLRRQRLPSGAGGADGAVGPAPPGPDRRGLEVRDEMGAHGVALEAVRTSATTATSSAIDPDIKANAPFVRRARGPVGGAARGGQLRHRGLVRRPTSPAGHPGVAGEYFFGEDGFVFGGPTSPSTGATPSTRRSPRWGIHLGSAGPELSEAAHERLAEAPRAALLNLRHREDRQRAPAGRRRHARPPGPARDRAHRRHVPLPRPGEVHHCR